MDVAEEDLFGWQNDLQVKAWDTLLENHLSDSLVTARFNIDVLNGAVGWSVVWPQVNLQDFNELPLNLLKDLWHIDILTLNDNLVKSSGLKTDNFFQFNNSLWGDWGDWGYDLLQPESLWRLHAEGLLGLGGLSSSSSDDLGLLAIFHNQSDLVLEVKGNKGLVELFNIPQWENWHDDMAANTDALDWNLWNLRLKDNIPFLADLLGLRDSLGSNSSSQDISESPWAGRLEDQVGGQGHTCYHRGLQRSRLKLADDFLQDLLATLVDLGGDWLGVSPQWAQGRDQLTDTWVGHYLSDLRLREGSKGLLDQGVVINDRLSHDLGGNSNLDFNTQLLGRGQGWYEQSGHLVEADRGGKVLRHSWGSPAKQNQVEWVLVDGNGLDLLNGWGLGQQLKFVDVTNGGVRHDVVVSQDSWSLSDWLNINSQFLGWDIKLNLHGSWDIDDRVLIDTSGKVLAGEWANSANNSRVLGGQNGLGSQRDGWQEGLWLDCSLSNDRNSDWGINLNMDWEAHIRWEHDLHWRQ